MRKFGLTVIIPALIGLLTPFTGFGQVLGIEGESHTSVGIYIKDIKADTVVFAAESERNLVPASILKSYTTATALNILGSDYRFKTAVYADGTVSDSVLDGSIRVVPGGDPTLESSQFRNNSGFADSIVCALKRNGISVITGNVSVDCSDTEGGPVPQWEIDDVAWSYGAGIHRFNYRDNTFTYNPATGKCDPEIPGMKVELLPNRSGLNVVRGIWSETLYAFTSDRTSKGAFRSTVPFPHKVFEAELSQKLNAAGITVKGEKTAKGTNNTELYVHRSLPLREILKSLMFRSDNMFAEGCLLALSGDGNRSAALKRQEEHWSAKGLDSKYVTAVDGSGLARVNRVSPRFMADMLQTMANSKNSELYTSFFPRVGKEGTVKSFLKDTALEGRMALKTGSMNGVQCYAGYAFDTDDKPSHVVVVMINGFFCSRDCLRTAITRFLLNNVKI